MLDNLLFREAESLKRKAHGRGAFATRAQFLAPLVSGSLGGTFAFLGGGSVFNELVPDVAQPLARPLSYWGVSCGTALVSFVLLTADLGSRMAAMNKDSLWDRWAPRLLRVGAVYAFVCALVTVETSMFVLALRGTALGKTSDPLWQLGLWAPVSMFFGVFVGLVLQGRSAAQRDV